MFYARKKIEIFENQKQKTALFIGLTAQLKDNRSTNKGNICHSLQEILFLTLSGVVSGQNTWESIAEFGKLKLEWFRKYFAYKDGTPSHDT
jgi:DDE_Tnp_1-associated